MIILHSPGKEICCLGSAFEKPGKNNPTLKTWIIAAEVFARWYRILRYHKIDFLIVLTGFKGIGVIKPREFVEKYISWQLANIKSSNPIMPCLTPPCKKVLCSRFF